ncbi:hypothetical protein BDB13_6197 [Rhodococcus sp. OK302]|nr:hypothetical protein BDB13_6197 [Rhodococcus sp. OK302]
MDSYALLRVVSHSGVTGALNAETWSVLDREISAENRWRRQFQKTLHFSEDDCTLGESITTELFPF